MAISNTPITHRSVWLLAGPMIISNISVPLVGAVDTAVVGHLPGIHHIGAVALGALIFSFVYWGFGFLKMGITGFIARAYGAGDDRTISLTILRFLLLGLAMGCLVALLGDPLVTLALHLLNSSEKVETLAAEYSLIRIWSAPATLCVYVFTGIFVGLHNTRMALVLQLILNLTNVVLDLLFVPVLELGVAGVAWATLIAEYTASFFGFFFLRKRIYHAIAETQWKEVVEVGAVISMMKTNSNIFIRTICLVFSFAFFTAQSAKLGDVFLAVNTVLLHFNSIMAYALDGFAHSVEALGGSAYGAGNRQRFKRAVFVTALWIGIASVFASITYFLFGEHILGLFTNSTEVLETASHYLIWMIISPIISCSSYHLDGLFIGTGYAREMRNAMIVSTLGYLGMVYVFQALFENHGLFLALSGFMVLRTLTLLYYYPSILKAMPNHET